MKTLAFMKIFLATTIIVEVTKADGTKRKVSANWCFFASLPASFFWLHGLFPCIVGKVAAHGGEIFESETGFPPKVIKPDLVSMGIAIGDAIHIRFVGDDAAKQEPLRLKGGLGNHVVTDCWCTTSEAFVGETTPFKDGGAHFDIGNVGGIVDRAQLSVVADEPFMTMSAFDGLVFIGGDNRVFIGIADHATTIWAGPHHGKTGLVNRHQDDQNKEPSRYPLQPNPFQHSTDQPKNTTDHHAAQEQDATPL